MSEANNDDAAELTNDTGGNDRIIVHLRCRITQLIDNLNAAESKAALFHAECNRLKTRLQLSGDEKATADRKLRELEDVCRNLRDELATTVRDLHNVNCCANRSVSDY